MNLSQITKKLSIRGGCGGGRWRIDPQFFVHSKVDIFQWLLLEMVIWMEIFFFQYNKDVRPSVLSIIEVIHKEEVGGGFYIPNIDFFSILNVGCFFRAEIPAR